MARPPMALVGFKAYFGQRQTTDWFAGLETLVAAGAAEGVDVVVIPVATALAELAPRARAAGVALGAQDCSWAPPGAHTGELPAALLAEVGASVVEIGHVERRTLFGDTGELVRRKAVAAVAAGLTPFVCVGEPERWDADAAVEHTIGQLTAWLDGVDDAAPVIVGYEPTWAIGAAEPAPADHIRPVCQALGEWLRGRGPGSRVLYGGTAGPGQYAELADALDGLALGRRVHDVSAFGRVLEEMRAVGVSPPVPGRSGPPEAGDLGSVLG